MTDEQESLPTIKRPSWVDRVPRLSFLELFEHYPMIETAPRIDICLSRNRRCEAIFNRVLGIQHGEGYHIVHHKFPLVPQWRSKEVHDILMEDELYASLNQVEGLMPHFRSMMAEVGEARLLRDYIEGRYW